MTDQAALSSGAETKRRAIAEPVTDAESARRAPKSQPVSLYPLSFEEAVRALTATPPVKEEAKRRPAPSRKPKREKKPV
jgi:hypothetical protein